jgi:hypothetical protein
MTMKPSFYSKNKKESFLKITIILQEEPLKVNIGFNVIILFSSFNKIF